MKTVCLGKTGIRVPQNAFGCLPIQRDTRETAIKLLRDAYEGGMRFFDTARAYTDSEEKVGEAFDGLRDNIFIATKTVFIPSPLYIKSSKNTMAKVSFIRLTHE